MAQSEERPAGQAEKQPWQMPWLGWLCRIVAIPIGLAVAMIAQEWLNDGMAMARSRNTIMAGFAGIAIGFTLWRYGSRHLAPGAEQLLAGDGRPPILYLRSFANEKTVSEEEYAIAQALEPAGPFIAVGRPGEKLPPLGAARMYLTDDSWQDRVREVMARAQLILVTVGETPGLGWELSQCARLDDPTKLVLLVPNDRAVYDSFCQIADRAGLHLPAFPPKEHLQYATSSLALLIRFNSDWSPVYVPLPQARGRDTGFNDSQFRGGRAWGAMAHIMRQKGVELGQAPRDFAATVRTVVLIVLIPAIVFLIAMFAAIALGVFDMNCTSSEFSDCIDDARWRELTGA